MPTQTYSNRFEALLRERAELERSRVLEEIAGGEAVTTLDSYRERVGYLRAIAELGEWCDTANKDLNEG